MTQETYNKMLKAKRIAMKALNRFLDLKIQFIDESKTEGIYNPELKKKLEGVSVEV